MARRGATARSPRLGFGERPALLVIDLLRAYTTPGSPLFAPGVVRAVGRLGPLLAAARIDFREILGFCMVLFCVYVPVVSLAFLLFPR